MGSPTIVPDEVIRSTEEEKEAAITSLLAFQMRNDGKSTPALNELQRAAVAHENIFESLLEASKSCSLGQMSEALYRVGGQYRRSM
jgi:methylmalonyl-CoA mutase